MHRSLRNSIEAEAISLEADARRIEAELKASNAPENSIRLYVEPRREAATKLRDALRACDAIIPVG